MTWGELKALADALGVEDADDIEIEFPDFSGWGPGLKYDVAMPQRAYREYGALTLTVRDE